MPIFVKIARGEWQVDKTCTIWTFVDEEPNLPRGVYVTESTKLSELKEAVRKELQAEEGNHVQLTWSWPQYMIGKDVSTVPPSDLVQDTDVQTFTAVRVEYADLVIRVRIVPETTQNDDMFNGGSQIFGSGKRQMVMDNNYLTQIYPPKPTGRVDLPGNVGYTTPRRADNPMVVFPVRTTVNCSSIDAFPPSCFGHQVASNTAADNLFNQVGLALTAKDKGKGIAYDSLPPLPQSFIPNFEAVRIKTVQQTAGTSNTLHRHGFSNTFTHMLMVGSSENTMGQSEIPYAVPTQQPNVENFTTPVAAAANSTRSESVDDIYTLWRKFGCGGYDDPGWNPPFSKNLAEQAFPERAMELDLNLSGQTSRGKEIGSSTLHCLEQGNFNDDLVLTLGNSSTSSSRYQATGKSIASTSRSRNPPTRWRLFESLRTQLNLGDDALIEGRTSNGISDSHNGPDCSCCPATDTSVDMEISGQPMPPQAGGGPILTLGQSSKTNFDKNTENQPISLRDGLKYGEDLFVPTIMYDMDAPPYFDEPKPKCEVARAVMDLGYEGDDIFPGRVYKSKSEARIKLAIHAVHRKFHFRHVKSRSHIMHVICVSARCPWRVYLTQLENTTMFQVQEATLTHTCAVDSRCNFQKMASTEVMRSRYLGLESGPKPSELRRMLRQEFSINVSYWKAWRAREIAMESAMGSAMGSYALVRPYFDLLRQTNPNSLVQLETVTNEDGQERFKYAFFSLDACICGFEYMRKVVVIDGAHLTGKYGGVIMGASAQDANFQCFPVAFAVVDSENDSAWEWFLTLLQQIIPDSPSLVFVSDRHGSIYKSIRKVYPMASHGSCIVHLQRNVVAKFKSENLSFMVGEAARAYRVSDFTRLFRQVEEMNPECASWLTNIGFEHWTQSHFVGNRYNVMTSNVAESINKVLVTARAFPIISIFESIRTTLLTWFLLRREKARTEEDIISPKIQEAIIENFEKSTGFVVMKIRDDNYEVRDRENEAFHVKLAERKCSCMEFQILKYPCAHAVAAAIQEGIPVSQLAAMEYTTTFWRMSYEAEMKPVPNLPPNQTEVGAGGGVRVRPPNVHRPSGRPKKLRIASTGEFKRKVRHRCSRCKTLGHNKATCRMPLHET